MRKDKPRALSLRKSGKSYNEINKILGVPKSTLSVWLKNLKFSQKVLENNVNKSKQLAAKNITVYNKQRSRLKREQWIKIQNTAEQKIGHIIKRELLLVGAALYWAEGYKKGNWSVMFRNSDPGMVKIMMQFFRNICKVKEEKFRPQIQIHRNVDEQQALQFWSKIIKLHVSSFSKTLYQIPRSSKSRRHQESLPYGVMRIQINDVKLVNRIKGLISGLNQTSL